MSMNAAIVIFSVTTFQLTTTRNQVFGTALSVSKTPIRFFMSRQVKAPSIEPYKKVVVALGGKLVDPAVIHEAIRISTIMNAKLVAVHIRYPSAGKPTMMMDSLPAFGEEDLRQHFRKRGYTGLADKIAVRIFDGANTAKVLARVTKGADLLILGLVQRNRILQAVSGKPPNIQLMDLVDCPVLLVPDTRKKKVAAKQKAKK